MGQRIKVEGYLDIEDDEYDDGDLGPLTAEAYEKYSQQFGLEDMNFSLAADQD